MKENKITILKVLVGSQAHGLADENSDYDYRAVYILPTSNILSLGYKYHGNDWMEGNEDNTSYEIAHFLSLATKCNPTILEVFKAPIVESNEDGKELRDLFTYIWNSKDAVNAFIGYGLNQRKKFLDKKDNRQNKYAVAYIRTLYNLLELLCTEDFNVKLPDCPLKETLLKYKKGDYKIGEVIQHAEDIIDAIKIEERESNHQNNIEKINDYLLKIRKKYWI